MYFVENFAVGTVRAWHAHRHERKWVMAVSGAALACCVEIDDWESPSDQARCIDSCWTPSPGVLSIPAGFANGAMSLVPQTKLLYISDERSRSRSRTMSDIPPGTGTPGR